MVFSCWMCDMEHMKDSQELTLPLGRGLLSRESRNSPTYSCPFPDRGKWDFFSQARLPFSGGPCRRRPKWVELMKDCACVSETWLWESTRHSGQMVSWRRSTHQAFMQNADLSIYHRGTYIISNCGGTLGVCLIKLIWDETVCCNHEMTFQ